MCNIDHSDVLWGNVGVKQSVWLPVDDLEVFHTKRHSSRCHRYLSSIERLCTFHYDYTICGNIIFYYNVCCSFTGRAAHAQSRSCSAPLWRLKPATRPKSTASRRSTRPTSVNWKLLLTTPTVPTPNTLNRSKPCNTVSRSVNHK